MAATPLIEPPLARKRSPLATQEMNLAEKQDDAVSNSKPNPKTGSTDAARGLGGHSKDASHKPGAPAEMEQTDKGGTKSP